MQIWPRDDTPRTEAGRYRAPRVEISCLASGDLRHGTTGRRQTDTGRGTALDAWMRASPFRSDLPWICGNWIKRLGALPVRGGDIPKGGMQEPTGITALIPWRRMGRSMRPRLGRVPQAAQGRVIPRRAISAAMSQIPDLDEQGAVGRLAGAFRAAVPGIIPCRRDAQHTAEDANQEVPR
jgi:hypothetical protein